VGGCLLSSARLRDLVHCLNSVGKTPVISGDHESKPRRALQRYYPWLVIGISFLTVGIAFGTRNAFAVFLIAVIEEFKWSRGLASGALMLGSVMWTVAAPVIGVLLDRFGPRIVLTAGSVIMASGFVISGSASSIVEFYLGMGIFMGVGFAALTMTSQATFLSNWLFASEAWLLQGSA
jgi:MFS family permease